MSHLVDVSHLLVVYCSSSKNNNNINNNNIIDAVNNNSTTTTNDKPARESWCLDTSNLTPMWECNTRWRTKYPKIPTLDNLWFATTRLAYTKTDAFINIKKNGNQIMKKNVAGTFYGFFILPNTSQTSMPLLSPAEHKLCYH